MQAGVTYIGITTPFYCYDAQGYLLMHQRSKNCRDEIGRWDTGSGQLEHGLTLEANVLKEVSEEYGCNGKITHRLPAHDIFRKLGDIPTHWLAVPFFIQVDRNTVKMAEVDKMDDLRWVTLSTLPAQLHTGFSHTLTTYRSEFEKYLKH